MQYCHIGPLSLFKQLDKVNDMHLLLYHWGYVSDRYINLYYKSKVYKIADNSFYELKKDINVDKFLKFCYDVGADEVVAPDAMYNYTKTKQLVKKFINKFYYRGHRKIQAVVCGRTEKEMKSCYKFYIENDDINVIAFSRRGCMFADEHHDDARFRLVKECIEMCDIKKPIHLLGANNIKDYFRDWPKEVRSIDSKLFAKIVLNNGIGLHSKVNWKQKMLFNKLTKQLKGRGESKNE